MRRFAETVDELELVDMPLQGGEFTWNGGLNNQVWARLDRFLVSSTWLEMFNGATQIRLSRPISDHFPIVLEGGGIRRGPTPFRFENMWLKVEGFQDVVRAWWQGIDVRGSASYRLATKMKEIKKRLKVWNKEVFGRLETNKATALEQVVFWDRVESERILTVEEAELKKAAKDSFKKWVLLEEAHWRQHSREIWLREGDRNTGFFHRMASAHRRNNAMGSIKVNGEWLVEEQEVKEGIVNSFQQLLTKDMAWQADIGNIQVGCISQQDAEGIEVPFVENEILSALMEMNGDKAPGPDGFSVAFWQNAWAFAKEEIMEMFNEFHEHSTFVRSLNNTFLVLIPKKTGFFPSSRGLRQGDPLSPYLFVMGMEILDVLIRRAVEGGYLSGCNIRDGSSSSLHISHLFFADDTIVFCEANKDQVSHLSWILFWFEAASGLRMNLAKSEIIPVGEVEEIQELAAELGVGWGPCPPIIWVSL
ncbi:putative mitochondrial protein [Vitis vinifera]|uniref:Putative mitochondrial protein n=1 Tax=Vitis vinifera TaxID=29760 RepID=A0A438GVG0_VITVI|nr:putative mitochondrial protein [Vitis vinifera]